MFDLEEIKAQAEIDSFTEVIFRVATSQSERPVREVVAELAERFCLERHQDEDSKKWVMDDDEYTVIEIFRNGDLLMTDCDTMEFITPKTVSSSINYGAAL